MDQSFDYPHLLLEALKAGNVAAAESIVNQALQAGVAPLSIVDHGLVPAIRTIGDLFEQGRLFLPHLMRAAEALKKGMALLTPLIEEARQTQVAPATVVLGTVEGDIHDIGKNIVALLLSASGFQVVDLGASVPVNRFITEVEARPAQTVIIGLTSLLTTTMIQQQVLIDTLQRKGLRPTVKVMVGGACVSAEWARHIGADGYGLNAQEAVRLATRFTTSH